MQPRLESTLKKLKHGMLGVLATLGVIWCFYLLDYIPGLHFEDWLALQPRRLTGLQGVATMPLAHRSLVHLAGNTFSLAILLTLLAGTRKNWWQVTAFIVVVGGALTWLIGSQGKHVGASGLVFGLITFLIANGIFEKHPVSMTVSIVLGFFWLDDLIFGLFPFSPVAEQISWSAHWCGALAGVAAAWLMSKKQLFSPRTARRDVAVPEGQRG